MKFFLPSLSNWYRNAIRSPKYRWRFILGTLAYLLSPFDIFPDFLPIAGQIDDVALLTLLLTEVFQFLLDFVKSLQSKTVSTVTEGTKGETIDVKATSLD